MTSIIQAIKQAVQGHVARRSRAVVLGAWATVAVVVSTATVALAAPDDTSADRKAKPAADTSHAYETAVGDLLKQYDLPDPSLAGDTGNAGVPTGTSPRPTKPVATPPRDAGQVATYAGGAGTLTPAGIATLALGAGCGVSQAVIATAVAMAESGGSPAAQGDTTLMDGTWDWSAGLWQIRGLRSERNTGALRDSVANHDPATNATAMYTISSGCSDWAPWTTYTRGTYSSFLTIAQQAVAYVSGYAKTHGGALPPVAAPDPGAPIPVGGGGGNGGVAAAPESNGAARTSRGAKPSSGTTKGRRGGTGSQAPGPKTSRSPQPGGGGSSPRTSAPQSSSSSKPGLLPTRLPLPTTLPTTRLPLPTGKLPLPTITLPPILG